MFRLPDHSPHVPGALSGGNSEETQAASAPPCRKATSFNAADDEEDIDLSFLSGDSCAHSSSAPPLPQLGPLLWEPVAESGMGYLFAQVSILNNYDNIF